MTTNHFDPSQARDFVGAKWDAEIVPQLVEYIRIPNKSPMFDADWVKHGYMEQAVSLMETWARAQDVPG
ncbi:MAG TPA: peptidase M20, partial [Thermomonas sp.]|nr:peptidase M20 [Thermomonas sp.]